MTKRLIAAAIVAMAFASNAAAARERVNETRDAAAEGFVRVTVVRGELRVEGWDRSQIRVRGDLDEQMEEFIFDVEGESAFIEVKLPRNINSWCCEEGSDLTIDVPKGSHVDISVVSTDVIANDIEGGFELGGVSGDLRASGLAERVDVTTVSGDIDVTDASGRVQLKSVSGDIDGVNVRGDVRMQSVSGDVLAREIGEEINVESVSGDIEVIDAVYTVMNGHTVSGDVDVQGEMKNGGSLEFDSVSGSVRIQFSDRIDARFDIETGSGSIRNRISSDKPETSKYVRDETLRFVLGDGSGEVVIGTRSGDVVLSRD